MANSLHIAGTDASTLGVTVRGIDPDYFPMPISTTVSTAHGFGGIPSDTQLAAKFFSVQVVIQGTSEANLITRHDAFMYLLDPMRNGVQTLRFDNFFSGRYWKAKLSQAIRGRPVGALAHAYTLIFEAPDPRAYDVTEEDEDYVLSGSPQIDTILDGSTIVAGTVEADPVWILTNGTGGNVLSVTLNNTTAVESVTWAGTLADGELLKFDKARNIIEKFTGGEWVSAMSGKVAGGLIPSLLAQIKNSVTTTGISTGNLNVVWRARYL